MQDNLTVPILLGAGAGDRRNAGLVSTHAVYSSDDGSFWGGDFRNSNLEFAYTVQATDSDTDGVDLAANPLGAAADGKIVSAVHPHFPTDLSAPAFLGGPSQQVNGSAVSTCDAIHCTHLDIRETAEDSFTGNYFHVYFDPDGDAGLSSRVLRYQNVGYPILAVQFDYDDSKDPPSSSAIFAVDGRLTDRARQRLGMQVGDTVLPLNSASNYYFRYGDGDIDSSAPHEYDEYYWDDSGIPWDDDVIMLVKFIELPVTATFDAASYAADEGGSFEVTVTLGGPFQDRTVTLPLSVTDNGGATNADYSGVPTELVFMPEETEKTFTLTVTDDSLDDDDESVTLSFGTLPDTVKEGGTNEQATIVINDDDDPEVTVQFGQASPGRG